MEVLYSHFTVPISRNSPSAASNWLTSRLRNWSNYEKSSTSGGFEPTYVLRVIYQLSCGNTERFSDIFTEGSLVTHPNCTNTWYPPNFWAAYWNFYTLAAVHESSYPGENHTPSLSFACLPMIKSKGARFCPVLNILCPCILTAAERLLCVIKTVALVLMLLLSCLTGEQLD